MSNNKINNLYIITLIIIVNFILYYFNIPFLLNNYYKSFEEDINIKILNNSVFKKIKNIIIKNLLKYKILKIFDIKLVENKEEIKSIDTILEIKQNNYDKNYKHKLNYNIIYILMLTAIINIIIYYFKRVIKPVNDIDKIFIKNNNSNKSMMNMIINKLNSKISIFKKNNDINNISSEEGVFNDIHTNELTTDKIFSDTIKTKVVSSEEGVFNDIHTNELTTDKIFSDTIKTKIVSSEEGIFNDIHTHCITTNNILGNQINTNDLDAILINSKKIISENITGKKINTDILEAKDIAVISDRRYKKNILYNNISSDLLDNINLATFEYLNQNTNHIGFIAQEIEKYYPQLINKNKNGYLSVKYLEMIPLLLDYNKKLKNRILSIENKINI